MKDFEYQCKRCGDIWEYIPEDFPDRKHPTYTCPLCLMPIYQMIHDVYKDGLKEVLRRIWIRLTK